jgi:nitroimidazol reductase NimA-like FMN-containing flavoprotein (pyridoxamine 5'-phosphate oxidase superfamily)
MTPMSAAEIDELLANARIGRLAMASGDGQPYVIPLPFCWLGNAIYLRLPLSGRKAEILKENNRVCFETDVFTEDLAAYASVVVEGRLVNVDDLAEKDCFRAASTEKYVRLRNGYRPGHRPAAPLASLPVCRIEVARLSGRRKAPASMPALSDL